MRRALRAFRDVPFVLRIGIVLLRAGRSLGFLRSRRLYSHFPYKGVVTVTCRDNASFRIISRGHNIENGLYWDGIEAHEPRSMSLWMDSARGAKAVLDIGANTGVFGLAAAASGAGEVHAFEPLPRVHQILEENAALNPELPLHVWPMAVGAESGKATIFDPGGDAPTSASLSEEFSRKHFGDLPGQEIQVVCMDDFCRDHEVGQVDLVKIDVEGYEAAALTGMRAIVTRWRPVILMEVLDGQEPGLRGVLEDLWPALYAWNAIDEGDAHVSRNVLLQPRSGWSPKDAASVHG